MSFNDFLKNKFKLDVDIELPAIGEVPLVTQGDSIVLEFNILKDGKEYLLDDVETITLTVVRSDGETIIGKGIVEEGNVAKFKLLRSTTAELGTTRYTLQMYDTLQERVSTLFGVFVVMEDSSESFENLPETEQSLIQQVLGEGKAILDAAQLATIKSEETYTVWKDPVTRFGEIETKYPEPQHGWTVMNTSNGEVFRYDRHNQEWKLTQKQTDTAVTHLQLSKVDKTKFDDSMNSVNSQLAQTPKRGEISLLDVDKNKFQIDETFISDSLRQQITGDTPIHSTPPREGVTHDALADDLVQARNLDFVITPNNLINVNNLILNKTINTSGNVIDNAYHDVTEFIYVKPNQDIVLNNVRRWAIYDEAGNPIETAETNSLTTTEDTFYIVLSIPKTQRRTAQMNYGDTLLDFDEYKVELRRDDKNGLKIVPSPKTVAEDALLKDAVTPFAFKSIKKPNNIFNKNNVIQDKLINSEGNLTDNELWVTMNGFIDADSGESISKTPSAIIRVCFFDIDKKPIRASDYGGTTETITIPDTTHKIMISARKTSVDSDLMINKGVELLPYEEHEYELESTTEYPLKLSSELYDSTFPEIDEEDVINIINSRLKPFRTWDYERKDYQAVVDSLTDTDCEVDLIGQDSDENDIYSLSYGDIANKPTIFLIGNQHGMEWVAVHYLVEFMTRIAKSDFYDTSIITNLLETFSFYAVVSANPWGYINDSYTNANGVNLNRNWDKNWETFPENAGTIQYKGTAPFSEPETQLLRDKILELKPYMVIDCHATDGKGGINVGGGTWKNYFEETYMELINIFDDAGLPVQRWNMGGNPTAQGWVQEQSTDYGFNNLTTTLEQPMKFDGNYGVTALFALSLMAKKHYDNNVGN